MSAPLITALTALVAALIGGGGVLAWFKFYRSEAPQSDATIAQTFAQARLIDAEAGKLRVETESIEKESLRQSLQQAKADEQARIAEIASLRTELDDVKQRLSIQEDNLESLKFLYSPRGQHGYWDMMALLKLRGMDENYPSFPMPFEEPGDPHL